MTAPRWSADEISYLEKLVGDVPFPVLLKRMQKEQKVRGWPERTEKAIVMRIRRISQTWNGRYGHWVTTGAVGDMLGCPGTRVDAWLRRRSIREVLQPKWIGKVRYIERRAWRRLAREMPRVLGGFSADALYMLLEDRELAEQIAAEHPRPMGDFRIRCIETGRVWPSCSAAARELHVSQAAISLAIRRGRPVTVLGLKFEALRGEGAKWAA
jgi:hypothetical protein